MMEKNDKELRDLAKSVCEFYSLNRDVCVQQFNMAESQDLHLCYESVEKIDQIHQIFSTVSIVILTANKYEKNVLHANLFHTTGQKIRQFSIDLMPQCDSKELVSAFHFTWHEYSILHIAADYTGSYTMGGSADIVRFIRECPYMYPLTIVSLGICFGINEKEQSLGETVISNKIYPYFIGAKVGEQSYLASDNNMFRVNEVLKHKIRSEIIDMNLFNHLCYKVDFGNFITGEAVVSNKDARDHFVRVTTQPVAAGEMEGYGLFKECCGRNDIIPCIIIKSICDWGVLKNLTDYTSDTLAPEDVEIPNEELKSIKDRLQAIAAYNSYCVFDILLENNIFSSSIYNQVISLFTKKYENVVYFDQIKEAIENCDNITRNLVVSNEYISTICQVMEQKSIITAIESSSSSSVKAWKINK